MNAFAQKGKWIGLASAGLIGLALALIAGVILYINSDLGQRQIRDAVVSALHDAGIEASIGELSGPLPGTLRLHDVQLKDAKGLWFEVQEAVLEIGLWDILQGKVTVQEIAILSPTLLRMPELIPSTEPKSRDTSTGFIPRLPIAIDVNSVRIEHARIDAGVIGIPIEANLNASGRLEGARLQGKIAMDGDIAGVHLSSEMDANADKLDTDAPVFQAGLSVSGEGKLIQISAIAQAAPAEENVSGSMKLTIDQLEPLLQLIADKPEWKEYLKKIPPSMLSASGTLSAEITIKPVETVGVPEISGNAGERKVIAGGIRIHLSKMNWNMPEIQELLGETADLQLDGHATLDHNGRFPALEMTTFKLLTRGALGASGAFALKPTSESQIGTAELRAETNVTLGLSAVNKALSGDVSLKAQTRGMLSVEDLHGLGETAIVKKILSSLTSEVTLTSPRLGYGTGAQAVALDDVLIRLTGKADTTTKESLLGSFETTIAKVTGGGVSLGSKTESGFRLMTRWEVSQHGFAVHETRCDAAGLELKADLKGAFALPSRKKPASETEAFLADMPRLDGVIELAVRHWKTLSALTGIPLQGEPAHIRLEMRAEKTQQIEIDWAFGAVRAGENAVRGGKGKGHISGFAPVAASSLVPVNPNIDLVATFDAGKIAKFVWTGAKVAVSGPLETMKLDASLQGKVSGNVQLRLDLVRRALSLEECEVSALASLFAGASEGDIVTRESRKKKAEAPSAQKRQHTATKKDKNDPHGKNLSGNDSFGFRLRQPVKIGFADGIRIDDLALTLLPAGELTATGTLSSSKLRFQAGLKNLPLQLARFFSNAPLPNGMLNASVEMSGSPSKPTGTLVLVASDVAFPRENLPPIEIRIEGRLGSNLVLSGQITGVGDTPAVADLTLPIRFVDGIPTLRRDRPLQGSARWNGALAPLWQLVPLANTTLTGKAHLDASFSGTLAAPKGTLSLQIEKAGFEDILLGVMLTDINADVVLNPFEAGFSHITLSASDGKQGTVTCNGTIGAMSEGLPLALQGTFTNLSPLHRTDLSISLSGTAAVTGTVLSPLVAANVTINKGTFQIVRSFGTSLPVLDVVDAASLADAPTTPSPSEQIPQAGPQLQVSVTIPNQFFVRGSGFESEWKGNLTLSGPVSSPVLRGQLSSVRGQFALLGKQFTLTTGQVELSGGNPPNPLLHIVVSYAGPNITAEATVGGTALAPSLTLSSQPPMPQDEVMAQVLFGKSASELGRIEALQLAAEVASLATFGGGGGLLNETRSALGLDVLRFGSVQKYQQQTSRKPTPFGSLGQPASQSSEDQSIPTLEVGKYVFDNVYVGLEQGMNDDSGGVRIEIELAPHLNLEGRTTPEGSEIGVNWKKEY